MTADTRGSLALVAASLLALALVEPSRTSVATLILIPVLAMVAVAVFGTGKVVGVVEAALGRSGLLAVAVGVVLQVQWFRFVFLQIGADWQVVVTAAALCTLLVGSVVCLAYVRSARRSWSVFLAAYAASMVLLLVATHDVPAVSDVAGFEQIGVESLVHGMNPYAATYPDIYPPDTSELLYGDGLSVGGVLQFGYPYLPLGLLLVAPFEILMSDFRIAYAVAFLLAGLLIGRLSEDPRSRVVAALFLLLAPGLYMVRVGWMDALVVLSAVLVVVAARSKPAATSYATGLLLAIKQSSALFVLPSMLLLERPLSISAVLRHLAKAGAVLVAFTVPFAIWGPQDFYRSVVELQFLQPFRPDSIAFPALFGEQFAALPRLLSVGVPIVLVGILSVLVVVFAPTGPQGFALAAGFVTLVAFAVSKQAFSNYYLVTIAMLCCAAAVEPRGLGFRESGSSEVYVESTPTEETAADRPALDVHR